MTDEIANNETAPTSGPPASRLLDHDALLTRTNLPDRIRPVYAEFRRNVLQPEYPCYFGTAAEARGELRYVWVDGPSDPALPVALAEFVELAEAHPDVRHACVVFFAPGTAAKPHDAYREEFWSALQFVHEHDPKPWPEEQPTDPEDARWEFCFAGLPLFVFAAAPSHHRRRSRNVGPCLTLLFQPRSVFRGIEGGTPAGERARKIIRERLVAWEGLAPHPDLGNYGDPSTNEWKQYFLPDDASPVEGPCPFVYRDGKERASGGLAVVTGEPVSLEVVVRELLPAQGSVEVQRDVAGRTHAAHTHVDDELLVVVDGELRFYVGKREWVCGPGTRIHLPAGTVHESEAGAQGAVYVIATR